MYNSHGENSFSIKRVSSNINEVIRAVLNSLFFYLFFTNRFCMHKKHQKVLKAPNTLKTLKATKSTKSTKNTKSTKRHKDTQAKAQNTNKWISDYFPLRCFLRSIFYFCSLVSVCSFLWLWKFRIKKFKIALITSFIVLPTIVINTHFAPLKDLSKDFACMTNDNLNKKNYYKKEAKTKCLLISRLWII